MSLKQDKAHVPGSLSRRVPFALALLTAGLIAGCASSNDAAKALNPDPPDKMYAAADTALQRGAFNEAARRFEELDRDHPYAPEARRAVVMAAYAYYKASKYPEAIASAQRYTTMHPGTKEAALAHHIIASAYFDEIREPSRDQTATRKALNELKLLRSRYPDSPYSRQADNRVRLAEDALAASEMSVARYYVTQNNHIAAINRFKTVVTDYQTTAHVEEALFRLVELNIALGITPEAQSAAAVLGHNFPNSKWYSEAHGLLKKYGSSPQVQPGNWLATAIKTQPAEKQVAPQPVPQGLPSPDQLPAPRKTPASDIPTASTAKPKPMGLGMGAPSTSLVPASN